MITPHQLDLWSSNMAHLYQSLEGELIRLIAKRLNSGHDDILDWQRHKLQELHLFNKDAVKVISQITGLAETEIIKMFKTSGDKIVKSVDGQIPYEPLPQPSDLDNIMKAYHDQVWSDINNYVNQTLLSTNFGYGTATTQMYNDIVNKTTAAFNSGLFTFDEALERTIQEWAQKGIRSTFVDKGGHTWSLERYVRTVLKSTLGNTYDKLRKERMSEYDIHTVVVTSHMGARQACSRIQGHVVDLRESVPANSQYKSIYDPYWQAEYGTKGGHRGINCNHLHIPFIPGVNTNNQPHYDTKENAKVAELTKQQRNLERQMVKFKKNKKVAEALGNDAGAKKWQQAVTGLQRKMADLVNSNPYLSRNYAREKVYTPIDTLMKDFRYDNKYDNIREKINPEKFNRHVRGTKEYEDYFKKGTKAGNKPSYLSISSKRAQQLINEKVRDFNKARQQIDFGVNIGYYVDQTTGKVQETTVGVVHTSKTGIHIVPTRPRGE